MGPGGNFDAAGARREFRRTNAAEPVATTIIESKLMPIPLDALPRFMKGYRSLLGATPVHPRDMLGDASAEPGVQAGCATAWPGSGAGSER